MHRFWRPVKQAVSLWLDADVIAWLKKDGQGYQTRANQMLWVRMLKELEGKAHPASELAGAHNSIQT